MSDGSNTKSAETVFISVAILGAMLYGAASHLYFVWAYIWRVFKIAQMFLLFAFENIYLRVSSIFFEPTGWGFKEAFFEILSTHYSQISPEYMTLYDSYFGGLLRWPFALLLIYLGIQEFRIRGRVNKVYDFESILRSASMVHPHLRRLVPPNWVDRVLANTVGWIVPSFRERLKGENPIDFSHDFDFNDRRDETNRYAMGISPYEMLSICPPLGVSQREIDDDLAMQKSTGFTTNFRPICHFFFEEDAQDSTIDFCMRTATMTLERMLLMPLCDKIENRDFVGRLFDSEGNLVPLEFEDGSGNPQKKWTRNGKVVGGFRPTTLLNDGVEYKGSVEDTIKLFNEHEQKVLLQLKKKMDGKVSRSFEEILYVIVTKRHAYSTTVIWALMHLFKDVNRIAGTEFSWLTRDNRGLAMILQSIGRETPFIEASAARAHYRMEAKVGFKVTVPSVMTAAEDLHVNAERIINAGKKSVDLMNMEESDFAKLFELNNSSEINKKENKATEILKSMGVDVGAQEKWRDPYDDVPELIKKFEKEKSLTSMSEGSE